MVITIIDAGVRAAGAHAGEAKTVERTATRTRFTRGA
jgi:hypothetical protein